MLVELSPLAYMTLCGLIQDALEHDSDAAFLLKKAQHELKNATVAGMIPSELAENPTQLETLRRSGFVGR